MDKNLLICDLKEIIAKELKITSEAARSAHEAATHEELVAENKYDTKGLEASYLAGAQSKRAGELQLYIEDLETSVELYSSSKETIGLGSLVHIKDEDENEKYLFALAHQGGYKLQQGPISINTITLQSPMGRAMLSKNVEDDFELDIKDKKVFYEILTIY
ncbi:MAG: GreA/GreB family elongation factor [Bdellovibrionales bacterium]